eukprot:ANDGO_08399.mRNA.1 Cathepsin C
MRAAVLLCVVATLVVCTVSSVAGRRSEVVSRRLPGAPLEVIVTPLPHQVLSVADVPSAWDWRNASLSGTTQTNWVTPSINQHIPQYCGSCWLHASVSAFSDRLKIARRADFPEIAISRQTLLDCPVCGSCHGGDFLCTAQYLNAHGMGDETCAPYRAEDGTCNDEAYCKTCAYGFPGKCSAVTSYTKYYAAEFGSISGADAMKAEIYARGPIACEIDATANFEAFKGGSIYSEVLPSISINHVISVVGFGVDAASKEEFWVLRNSWGTYWADGGFARIKMHSDNLGIESNCVWTVPKI